MDGIGREREVFPFGSIAFRFSAGRGGSTTPPMIEQIHPGYGAIDVGQEKIFIACGGSEEVRSFGTCSDDFELAAVYLREKGVGKVAMEATGVYWIPLHDMLQDRGLEVTVFNGAHARNMPGRKSDVQDCQWHAMLHSHG